MPTTQYSIRKVADLDADMALYRLQGITGTASVNTTTNIDWKFPEERWMSGAFFHLDGGNFGDKVTVEIIDKDNVLGYGANVILNTFAADYYIHPTDSMDITCPYVALIPANIYIRFKYTNISLVNSVKMYCNLYTHIPKA